MSAPKSALSGLRTVKRDWSTSSKTDSDTDQKKSLDARAQRMRDIQDGLNRREQASLSSILSQNYTNVTTADIASGSKRPLPISAHEPIAKKRALPTNWENDVSTSSSNFTTTARTSTTTGSHAKTKTTGLSVTAATSPAEPVLSQEQTQILQLVQQGNSLFYTGSAGTRLITSFYAHIHIQLCRYRKVCSSAGDHPHPPEKISQVPRCSGDYCLYRCVHMQTF